MHQHMAVVVPSLLHQSPARANLASRPALGMLLQHPVLAIRLVHHCWLHTAHIYQHAAAPAAAVLSPLLAGECYVELADRAAQSAAMTRHKELMGTRYIEIFHSSKMDKLQAQQARLCMQQPALGRCGAWLWTTCMNSDVLRCWRRGRMCGVA